jgi:hypothetical protein
LEVVPPLEQQSLEIVVNKEIQTVLVFLVQVSRDVIRQLSASDAPVSPLAPPPTHPQRQR